MIHWQWILVASIISAWTGGHTVAKYYDRQVDKWYNAGYAHGHKDADLELEE